MKLTIDQSITDVIKDFSTIAYVINFNDDYDALTKSADVDNLLNEVKNKLQNKYSYEEVTSIPKLKETRDGYKKLGKDPSHTRPACEALIRRILKGEDLYRLGDVIDLGNILSLLTQRSVCVVDLDKLNGDVIIRKGLDGEGYDGINRGLINLSKMPVYVDNVGPFGCPTSDTLRTVVDKNTKNIFIMIICFSENEKELDRNLLLELYNQCTSVKMITKIM